MSWLLFVVLIPCLAGAITGLAGVVVTKDPILYFAINLPIIFISITVYNMFFNREEK